MKKSVKKFWRYKNIALSLHSETNNKLFLLTFKNFTTMKNFAVIKTFDCLDANYVKGTFDNIRDAEEFIELLKKTEYQSKHINYYIYTLNK